MLLGGGAVLVDKLDAQTSVTVYDSLGTAHVLNLDFTKTATGWSYNATLPSSDISGATGTNTTIASGTLGFNSNGNLTSTTPVAFSIPGLADGASTLAFNWNLANASGTSLITQLAGASSTSSTSQNGNTSGSLAGFSIGPDGTITGAFTNGTQVLGQVALANFANLERLTKQGGNNYSATISSGSAVVGSPGNSSLGTLTGSALENSNVDMSTEFTNLIIAERGFQANAKSVTTFDQIAQDTINLVR
jgi:flagellar hook protein FlgE